MRRHGLLRTKDDINKTTSVPRRRRWRFLHFKDRRAPPICDTRSCDRHHDLAASNGDLPANGEAQLLQPQTAQTQDRDAAVAGLTMQHGIGRGAQWMGWLVA